MGPASDPVSYIVVVAWGEVRLRAEILSSPTTASIAPAKLFCFNHTAIYLEPRENRWWDSSLRRPRRTIRLCRSVLAPRYAAAGCAGEDSATNLTAATQGRAPLPMRYGGVLPGAATTAPVQHIISVAKIERFISEIGAALERRGTEPSALRRVRDHI